MYQIIFVSKQDMIPESLLSQIPDGYQYAGTFTNLSSCLTIPDKKQPSVIVLDASLYHQQWKEKVSSTYPQAIFVYLVTSKELASLPEAEHFLFKPVRLDEFSYLLSVLKGKLDRQSTVSEMYLQEQNYEMFLPALRERLANRLVYSSDMSHAILLAALKKLHLNNNITDIPCAVVRCKPLNGSWYAFEKEQWESILQAVFFEEAPFQGWKIENKGGELRFLIIARQPTPLSMLQKTLEHHICNTIEKLYTFFGLLAYFDVDFYFPNLWELNITTVSFPSSGQTLTVSKNTLPLQETVNAIRLYRIDHAFELFARLMDQTPSHHIEFLACFVLSVIRLIGNVLFSGDLKSWMEDYVTTSIRNHSQDKAQLLSCTEQIIREFASHTQHSVKRSDNLIVFKIKQYIADHYQQDISLNQVADYVYLSPVYLSRFFKEKTGEKFTTYLIRFRMEQAIQLFQKEKYQIQQVAAMVGYKDSKHFSKLFKLHTGCSPRQFCQSLLQEKDA